MTSLLLLYYLRLTVRRDFVWGVRGHPPNKGHLCYQMTYLLMQRRHGRRCWGWGLLSDRMGAAWFGSLFDFPRLVAVFHHNNAGKLCLIIRLILYRADCAVAGADRVE